MPYIPPHLTQRDGSESQWTNCWATVGAWLSRGASRNKRQPTPTDFRHWARRPTGATGGLGDIARGLTRKKLWGRKVVSGGKKRPIARYLEDRTPSKMRALFLDRPKGGGKLYAAESDFNALDRSHRCSKNFGNLPDAYHMIGVAPGEGKGKNKGKVRLMDPLCRKYKWVPVDEVVDIIIEYNDEHYGEKKGTADLIVVNVPDKK